MFIIPSVSTHDIKVASVSIFLRRVRSQFLLLVECKESNPLAIVQNKMVLLCVEEGGREGKDKRERSLSVNPNTGFDWNTPRC